MKYKFDTIQLCLLTPELGTGVGRNPDEETTGCRAIIWKSHGIQGEMLIGDKNKVPKCIHMYREGDHVSRRKQHATEFSLDKENYRKLYRCPSSCKP
jgi:hypothetical protein